MLGCIVWCWYSSSPLVGGMITLKIDWANKIMEVLLNRPLAWADADFTADESPCGWKLRSVLHNTITTSCKSHPFKLIEKCFRSFKMWRFVGIESSCCKRESLKKNTEGPLALYKWTLLLSAINHFMSNSRFYLFFYFELYYFILPFLRVTKFVYSQSWFTDHVLYVYAGRRDREAEDR